MRRRAFFSTVRGTGEVGVFTLSRRAGWNTPARLGAALFGDGVPSAGALAALYSLVHFGTFALIGAGTGWFLTAAGLAPGIAQGLVLGVCVLNGIHYLGLLIAGRELLGVLAWPHVVGSNLLAGATLMAFLHRLRRENRPLGLGILRYHPAIAEGITVGLLGAATVAAWFFLIDVAAGRPFHTPAALGSAVFLGATGREAISLTPGIVLAYSVLHVTAFLFAGLGFVLLARTVERAPSLIHLAVLGAILLEAITFSMLVGFGEWVLGAVSIWAIGIANLLAIGTMGGWIWRTHPELRERTLREGFAPGA